MMAEPKCFKRHCMYYKGVAQPDGTEMTEVNVCEAFPQGIPDDIAYGPNRHLRVQPNQGNNIVFKKKDRRRG